MRFSRGQGRSSENRGRALDKKRKKKKQTIKTFIVFNFAAAAAAHWAFFFSVTVIIFFFFSAKRKTPGRAVKMSTRKGRQRLNVPLAFSTMHATARAFPRSAGGAGARHKEKRLAKHLITEENRYDITYPFRRSVCTRRNCALNRGRDRFANNYYYYFYVDKSYLCTRALWSTLCVLGIVHDCVVPYGRGVFISILLCRVHNIRIELRVM